MSSYERAAELASKEGMIRVLKLIRDTPELTYQKLFHLTYTYPLGKHPISSSEYQGYEIMFLCYVIGQLYKSALITVSDKELVSEQWVAADAFDIKYNVMGKELDFANLIIEASKNLNHVQGLFGISLSDYSTTKSSLSVSPVFGNPQPKFSSTWSDIFVMMPFQEKLQPVYSDHILRVMKKLHLSCKRGDDFFSSRSIMEEIWSAIYHSRLCIADCTGRNPNVFYELGITHTVGRDCVLISQSIDDIPFDIRHLRIIIYEFTPRGMKEFEITLHKTVEHYLST